MAYNLRYSTEFKSSLDRQYKIELFQDGYTGSVSNPVVDDNGFILTYTSDSSDSGIMQRVMGSTCKVNYYLDDLTILADLAEATDKTFLLKISKLSFGSYLDEWIGYVHPDLSGYADEPFPTLVGISASDGFGWAKSYPFADFQSGDPEPYAGRFSHILLLQRCLTNIGIILEMSAPSPLAVKGSIRGDTHGVNDAWLEETYVDAEIFSRCEPVPDTYNPLTGDLEFTYTYSTIYEVLEYLCNFWGCRLFQSSGTFNFIPTTSNYQATLLLDLYGLGSVTRSGTRSATTTLPSSFYQRLKGGRFQYFPAKNNVRGTDNYFLDPISELNPKHSRQSHTVEGYYPCTIDYTIDINSVQYFIAKKNNPFQDGSYGEIMPPLGNTVRFINAYKITLNNEWFYYNRVVKVSPNTTTSTPRWVRDVTEVFSNLTGSVLDISEMDGGLMPDREQVIYLEANGVPQIPGDDFTVDLVAKTITLTNITLTTQDTCEVTFMYSEYAVFHVILTSTPSGVGALYNQQIVLAAGPVTFTIPPAPDKGTLEITSLFTARPIYSFTTGDNIYFPRTLMLNDFALPPNSGIITSLDVIYVKFFEEPDTTTIVATYDCVPPNNGSISFLATNDLPEQSDSTDIEFASGDGIFPTFINALGLQEEDTTQTFCLTRTELDLQTLASEWIYSTPSGGVIIGRHHEVIPKLHVYLQQTPTRYYEGTLYMKSFYTPAQAILIDLDGNGEEVMVPINLSFNANLDHWRGKWLQLKFP